MLELSCCDGVIVVASLFLVVVVCDGELAGLIVVDVESERDAARSAWRSMAHIQGIYIPRGTCSLVELTSRVDMTNGPSSVRGLALAQGLTS